MIWQFVQTTQISQGDIKRHIVGYRQHLEIHSSPDGLFVVRHRGAQLFAFGRCESATDFFNHVARQIVGQIGQIIGIQRSGCGKQVATVHLANEPFTHEPRKFDEDFAIMSCINQAPNRQSVLGGQGLQNEGHICGVQSINPGPQVRKMLGLRHPLGETLTLMIRPGLTPGQVANQAEPSQQFLDFGQRSGSLLGVAWRRGFGLIQCKRKIAHRSVPG